jgi:uncharacterized Zn finger protein
MSWYGYAPYVPVAKRRANAAREVAKLAKKGRTVTPVRIDGREIARTFWGKAWCENLESYSDFENRLPRGRTYVRNGSVVDLQIKPGKVTARVSGSELYEIDIKIRPLAMDHWQAIISQCAGKIASVLELLQGRLSQGVMEIITDRQGGLFPKPSEISLECSCPDWADMCKHVAAALYGVGARLDEKPELLFTLRQVDHMELIEQAATSRALGPSATSDKKTIAEGDLAEVFGIEMDTAGSAASARSPAREAAKASAKAPAEKVAKDKVAKPRTRRDTAARRAKAMAEPPSSAGPKRGRAKPTEPGAARRTSASQPSSRASGKRAKGE